MTLQVLESLGRRFGLKGMLVQTSLTSIPEANHPCYSLDSTGAVVGLSLSNLGLREVPSEVEELPHLHTLRLHGNRLRTVPAWLASLPLRRLYLPLNEFDRFPDVVTDLEQLEVLALNTNPLAELPLTIAKLQNLRRLGLQLTGLKKLPPQIQELRRLKGLYITRNEIRELPAWIGQLQELEELAAATNPIDTFPREFGQLSHLRRLNLGGTLIKSAPVIGSLRHLQILQLFSTRLDTLPPDFGKLSSLRELDLSGTAIQSLPASFAQLSELRVLRLANLRVRDVGRHIASLDKVEELSLSGTLLMEVPDLTKLQQLKHLDLSATGLHQFPTALLDLPSLKRLNLVGNKIRALPREIAHAALPIVISRSKGESDGILLAGNPIETPPPEIIRQGGRALRSYFRSLDTATKPVNEAKLLLVGDGGAGKTSLVKRLTGRVFNEHEAQTHGINIETFFITLADQRVKLNFWDFGGQEIMHATHQFFLSKRSAYILVLDGRKDEKTEYWLKHIESFGGSSPVLIVLNKIDEHAAFDVNRRFLADKYPNIVGFHRVSCKDGSGIIGLQKALAAAVARVELTRTLWATSWFDIKQELEEMTENYISYSEFRAACKRAGVHGSDVQETIVEFLHDLGIVLRFKDLSLRDTNVINPRWVTEGVYRLINAETVARNGGVLPLTWLSHILDSEQHPPEKHHFLIELMKKFELCYVLSAEAVLLPGLLPIEEPKITPMDSAVRFVVDYEFLPKSVMPRFIVRMHTEIEKNLRWRTGVVLYNRSLDTRAVIKADEVERRVDVAVSGERRREYLGIVLHALRDINLSFEKLRFTERVVMPDNPLLSISYSHLTKLEARGIEKYMPDGAEREYVVRDLIGWVQPPRRTEDEILEILRELKEKGDTEASLLEKANSSIMLQPNFFGLGINLNELIRRLFRPS